MGEKDDQKKGVWVDIQRQFWANRLLKNCLKVANSLYPECLFMHTEKKQKWEGLKSIGLSLCKASTSKDSFFLPLFHLWLRKEKQELTPIDETA